MRTSGYTPYNVTYICDFGYVYSRGTTVTCDDAGILPAICIDLEKADFSYAGETSSTEILRHQGKNEADDKADHSAADGLHNPVITDDETLPGGKNVTWSAVTFGSYPQTEILKSGEVSVGQTADSSAGQTAAALDAENSAGQAAGGQEVDPAMWNRLQEAEWDNDKASVDGAVFCRMDGSFFRYDPVTWRVLEVTDESALLLADQALDCFSYHSALTDVNWKDSAVHSWLNSLGPDENQAGEDFSSDEEGFFNTAFADQERQAVINGSVPNADNHYFGTSCGEETCDRVFLLSEDEIFSSPDAEKYGFQMSDAVADPAKRFTPTAYAQCRGAWQSDLEESKGNGFWILRSNGYTAANMVYVGELGYIYNRGIPVTCRDCSIVPAIRIDLKLADLTCTGEISSVEKLKGF